MHEVQDFKPEGRDSLQEMRLPALAAETREEEGRQVGLQGWPSLVKGAGLKETLSFPKDFL